MDRVHRQTEAIDVHCLAGSVAGPAVHAGRQFMADAYAVRAEEPLLSRNLGTTDTTGLRYRVVPSGDGLRAAERGADRSPDRRVVNLRYA